jgi:hypothetical protein
LLRYVTPFTPCYVFDGPINDESFVTYVEHLLMSVLKPGGVVVIDNLNCEQGKTARRQAKLLPPLQPAISIRLCRLLPSSNPAES